MLVGSLLHLVDPLTRYACLSRFFLDAAKSNDGGSSLQDWRPSSADVTVTGGHASMSPSNARGRMDDRRREAIIPRMEVHGILSDLGSETGGKSVDFCLQEEDVEGKFERCPRMPSFWSWGGK
ncbi:unnamed protein product [Victoria cruziana]